MASSGWVGGGGAHRAFELSFLPADILSMSCSMLACP